MVTTVQMMLYSKLDGTFEEVEELKGRLDVLEMKVTKVNIKDYKNHNIYTLPLLVLHVLSTWPSSTIQRQFGVGQSIMGQRI